jgi:hypothetical protein
MAQEFVYELLVRGDLSGMTGAHVIRGRVITDEDGEKHTKLGKAEALDLDFVPNVLGEETAKYVIQIQKMQAEAEVARQALLDSQKETIVANQAVQKLKGELTELQGKLDAQNAVIAQMVEDAKPHVCNHNP